MYPEDRVLVGVMPHPHDLQIAREQHWYRVPVKHAPKGIEAEYIAFYFTRQFSAELRWAIHFFARRTGHELARRVDLLPEEPDHPRAQERYYKLQLGPIRQKQPPIVSVRWRRITFIHTTWDRFMAAHEINDLFSADEAFVDRVYYCLKEHGIQPEREVEVREGGASYTVDLAIPCKQGMVIAAAASRPGRPKAALMLGDDVQTSLGLIEQAIQARGGPLLVDVPL